MRVLSTGVALDSDAPVLALLVHLVLDRVGVEVVAMRLHAAIVVYTSKHVLHFTFQAP